jgi:formate dehydrogenase maturation protein FdhE
VTVGRRLPAESFTRRAERAEALAPGSASVRAPLEFAAGLFRAQGRAAATLHGRPLSGRLEEDLRGISAALADVRHYVGERAPGPLAAAARVGTDDGLVAFWRGPRSGVSDFLARAVLRPYVEVLAARQIPAERFDEEGCAFCGGRPWIAWRRALTVAEGAQRYLGCALCGGEETLGRILCPGCGEADPHKLPAFTSERHPAVRIEACATCKRYVKSLDLTVDARAVPEVDDLVSVSMDLWAADEGWTRIEPGLAGV